MNLTVYNRNKLLSTFKLWDVPKDFADPMYNYLVFGFMPGSCFTSVLANDFHGAIRRSHPGNTIEAFKALAGWINDVVPSSARGSYARVSAWHLLSDEKRRSILELHKIIHTKEEEVWLTLQNKPTVEPVLY
jgi:hypothetical protein